MRLAFVGDGIIYNPESGLVLPDQGEGELALLQRTLAGMTFPDEVAKPARFWQRRAFSASAGRGTRRRGRTPHAPALSPRPQ